jgi:hypothetical protein
MIGRVGYFHVKSSKKEDIKEYNSFIEGPAGASVSLCLYSDSRAQVFGGH